MNCPICKSPRDPVLLRCQCLTHNGLKTELMKIKIPFQGNVPKRDPKVEEDLRNWEMEQEAVEGR